MNKKKYVGETQKEHLKLIKPSTQLGIVITKVSKDGMSRRMKVLIADEYKKFVNITYLIAELCDLPVNEKGVEVTGCGMDMTFWLANYITSNLWD